MHCGKHVLAGFVVSTNANVCNTCSHTLHRMMQWS